MNEQVATSSRCAEWVAQRSRDVRSPAYPANLPQGSARDVMGREVPTVNANKPAKFATCSGLATATASRATSATWRTDKKGRANRAWAVRTTMAEMQDGRAIAPLGPRSRQHPATAAHTCKNMWRAAMARQVTQWKVSACCSVLSWRGCSLGAGFPRGINQAHAIEDRTGWADTFIIIGIGSAERRRGEGRSKGQWASMSGQGVPAAHCPHVDFPPSALGRGCSKAEVEGFAHRQPTVLAHMPVQAQCLHRPGAGTVTTAWYDRATQRNPFPARSATMGPRALRLWRLRRVRTGERACTVVPHDLVGRGAVVELRAAMIRLPWCFIRRFKNVENLFLGKKSITWFISTRISLA